MDIHTQGMKWEKKGKEKDKKMQNGDDGEAQNLRKDVCNVSMDDMSIRVQQRFSSTERDSETTERGCDREKKMNENARNSGGDVCKEDERKRKYIEKRRKWEGRVRKCEKMNEKIRK